MKCEMKSQGFKLNLNTEQNGEVATTLSRRPLPTSLRLQPLSYQPSITQFMSLFTKIQREITRKLKRRRRERFIQQPVSQLVLLYFSLAPVVLWNPTYTTKKHDNHVSWIFINPHTHEGYKLVSPQ